MGQTVAHGSGADANGDGLVDATDYNLWKASYGAVFGIGAGGGAPCASAGGHPVPESSAFVLAAFAGLILARCRGRRR